MILFLYSVLSTYSKWFGWDWKSCKCNARHQDTFYPFHDLSGWVSVLPNQAVGSHSFYSQSLLTKKVHLQSEASPIRMFSCRHDVLYWKVSPLAGVNGNVPNCSGRAVSLTPLMFGQLKGNRLVRVNIFGLRRWEECSLTAERRC